MSKGLAIARAFHNEGHYVIAADFEPYGIPVCGRFSIAVEKFYRLPQESQNDSAKSSYVQALLSIVRKEKIDLWVSCSGVASALEDARAAEAVEDLTNCKAIQFNLAMTDTLHEKFSFNENTRKLGLNVPETHIITSIDSALAFLHPQKESSNTTMKYILKPCGVDDTARGDMTLLPLSTISKTRSHMTRLNPSRTRPFVLQQYIRGPEYCTHSLVVRGKVMLFTACPSADMLMHYQSLPTKSALFQEMLRYTKRYAKQMAAAGKEMTGHFSLDFLVDGAVSSSNNNKDLMENIYPIECNPRAHTAVVLFSNDSAEMVECYLHTLSPTSKPSPYDKNTGKEISTLHPSSPLAYYWLGHDLVTRVLLPLYHLSTFQSSTRVTYEKLMEFYEHISFWKQGTNKVIWKEGMWEVWDPLPFWWAYCVYWPSQFVVVLWIGMMGRGSWWSRCNVSTGKIFRC